MFIHFIQSNVRKSFECSPIVTRCVVAKSLLIYIFQLNFRKPLKCLWSRDAVFENLSHCNKLPIRNVRKSLKCYQLLAPGGGTPFVEVAVDFENDP